MFDTNIFNEILDGRHDIENVKRYGKFFVTHIQWDEIQATKKIERRKALSEVFCSVQSEHVPTESALWDISKWGAAKWSDENKSVPTESFVLGTSRLGQAKLGNGGLFGQLLILLNHQKSQTNELDNNRKDALIGETCMRNGYVLVSNDRALRDSVNQLQGKSISLEAFFR
ncbi:MAG: hypothetical protein WCJ71_06440 [Candidatus Omnitrophota bacterium]